MAQALAWRCDGSGLGGHLWRGAECRVRQAGLARMGDGRMGDGLRATRSAFRLVLASGSRRRCGVLWLIVLLGLPEEGRQRAFPHARAFRIGHW